MTPTAPGPPISRLHSWLSTLTTSTRLASPAMSSVVPRKLLLPPTTAPMLLISRRPKFRRSFRLIVTDSSLFGLSNVSNEHGINL